MAVSEICSLDGAIAPTAETALALPDDGLFRGDGAFEVIRLYEGRPFELDAHLDRLERSAAAIELPVEREPLERELAELVGRVREPEAQLRVVLTRGGRRLGLIEPLPPTGETTTLASVTYSPTGILDGVKSISYAANMQATRIAKRDGAEEALLVRPDRIVLEAPTSSIFWAGEDGRLRTPALGARILDSITRRILVAELEVEEGEYPLDELLGAEEAFLASTSREVQGVAAIDGHELRAPGRRTGEAAQTFARVRDSRLGAPEPA